MMAMESDRSVKAGRDIVGAQIITGDGNQAQMRDISIKLPPAETVDIRAAIAALQAALASLKSTDAGKIGRAMEDAAEEAAKDEPKKDEIATSIERAVKYAKGASDFGENVAKIGSLLAPVVGWLGTNHTALLAAIGLHL